MRAAAAQVDVDVHCAKLLVYVIAIQLATSENPEIALLDIISLHESNHPWVYRSHTITENRQLRHPLCNIEY